MERYTIYCTEAQTKEALELGAPIPWHKNAYTRKGIPSFREALDNGEWLLYICPTAEQMIGWLEDKGIHIEIEYCLLFEHYDFCILDEDKQRTMFNDDFGLPSYSSHSEATIAAIDAALDYLMKKEK